MTLLQTIHFVRGLIDTAMEAAEATKEAQNTHRTSYLHVSVEKVDVAAHFLAKAIREAA